MSRMGKIQTTYTKSHQRRYVVEITHNNLNKYQVIRGDNKYVVEQKARARMAQWDDMWARRKAVEEKKKKQLEKKQKQLESSTLAEIFTKEAQENLATLESILKHTLTINDVVDWEKIKDFSVFPEEKPTMPKLASKPIVSSEKYKPQLNILDWLIKSRREEKEVKANQLFKKDLDSWTEAKQKSTEEFQAALAKWEKEQESFLHEQAQKNASIDEQKQEYQTGDAGAILDYCDIVLSNSQYPDYFPQRYDLDYNPNNKILIVDYFMPALADIPRLKEVKYIKTRDDFSEKMISDAQANKLFDSLLYQISLRTIHELFEADIVSALAAVVFNGYVKTVDPATGQEQEGCVLSVQAGKQEFEAINLNLVDPKACFKNLKGVGSSKLHVFTPVAPLLLIERDDKRFVEGYAVAGDLEEEFNLAAMDWEDFEHLIREIFEKEFAHSGGEVKVTQASRDGGIDAVAFDPDPIRGGKIVIQAKRYTNTVGVSAVRDLYGVVINEGASKGILVTTSDYGPDSYAFAKGKPLTLLSGNNLLHLLEKHGHRAKIDLQEAKRILADKP